MSDIIDNLDPIEEIMLNARISSRVKYEGVSATHCEVCDEPIPEGRRLAIKGTKRCVDHANG